MHFYLSILSEDAKADKDVKGKIFTIGLRFRGHRFDSNGYLNITGFFALVLISC